MNNNGYNQQNGYQQAPPQNGGYNQQNRYQQAPPQYGGYNQQYNNYNNDPATFEQRRMNAYKVLIDKEKIAFIIWLIIGILQCLSIAGIICGAWNIYAAVQTNNRCKTLESYPRGVYAMYEREQTNLIIALVLNLILGGCIGIAGVIYDYVTRDYVMKNREYFE